VAFANPDGSVVAVVLNESDLAVSSPLSVAGEAVACSIPAHAIQTYVRPIK